MESYESNFTVHPHFSFRLAQSVLANELRLDPSRVVILPDILQTEDLTCASESRIRGLCYMMKSEPFSHFLFSNLNYALIAVEFACRLQHIDITFKVRDFLLIES